MSPTERIHCARGDLTRWPADAIVNAAAPALRGGGGVDGAIHRAAGPGLLAELVERYPEGCGVGEVRATGAHALPARHVLHVPGPIWHGGDQGEPELLFAAHRNTLDLASELDCRTVAFPAISCGVYGYPPGQAAEVAVGALVAGLAELPSIERVDLVLFSDELLRVFDAARARAGR